MSKFDYTYPNIGTFKQRGGLNQRVERLKEINQEKKTSDFKFIEIPADFVKNCKEEIKTGLPIGSFIDNKTVGNLYENDRLVDEIDYILHTEPVFRRNGCEKSVMTDLKWYNTKWLDSFIKHIFSIIDFFEILPYAIEIHPGRSLRKKNTFENLAMGIEKLYNKFNDKYNKDITIFIENRTGQQIKSGKDIKNFWKFFSTNYSDLIGNVGIILDIQQLCTVSKEKFIYEFNLIPKNSLSGLHVHKKHQIPSKSDIIPWRFISNEINSIESGKPLHILPEVFHSKHVEATYDFCKEVLEF